MYERSQEAGRTSNSLPSDCPDLVVVLEIAALDSSSYHDRTSRSVELSSGRAAWLSHPDRMETAAFSFRFCVFADGISRVVLVPAKRSAVLYIGLTRKGGRVQKGVIDNIPGKIGIHRHDEGKFLGTINMGLKFDH